MLSVRALSLFAADFISSWTVAGLHVMFGLTIDLILDVLHALEDCAINGISYQHRDYSVSVFLAATPAIEWSKSPKSKFTLPAKTQIKVFGF